MSTTDTTLLIILTTLLSIFFILCIAAVIVVIKLLSSVKKVVAKAENVVDSVESAAEVLKDTQGKLAFIKLVRNVVKIVNRSRK
jgi:hypothetical protein